MAKGTTEKDRRQINKTFKAFKIAASLCVRACERDCECVFVCVCMLSNQ